MLQNDFFYFTDPQVEGDVITTSIELNAAHHIFKGHFPEQPVLPGVCMMQMVKEVTEHHIKQKTRLVKADNLKFLSFIDPTQNKLIRMELKINAADEQIRVDAQLLDDTTTFFKFKGAFVSR